MRKLIYILLFLPLFANAQGELNNDPPVNPQQVLQPQHVETIDLNNVNPPAQQNVSLNNMDVNDNVGNDDVQVQAPGNDNVQKDKNGKEPYCKECEEIKKLKQQQMAQHTGSGITSGNGKTKHTYFRKFCFRTSKKMNRVFGKHKKNRPDYSCFNW